MPIISLSKLQDLLSGKVKSLNDFKREEKSEMSTKSHRSSSTIIYVDSGVAVEIEHNNEKDDSLHNSKDEAFRMIETNVGKLIPVTADGNCGWHSLRKLLI